VRLHEWFRRTSAADGDMTYDCFIYAYGPLGYEKCKYVGSTDVDCFAAEPVTLEDTSGGIVYDPSGDDVTVPGPGYDLMLDYATAGLGNPAISSGASGALGFVCVEGTGGAITCPSDTIDGALLAVDYPSYPGTTTGSVTFSSMAHPDSIDGTQTGPTAGDHVSPNTAYTCFSLIEDTCAVASDASPLCSDPIELVSPPTLAFGNGAEDVLFVPTEESTTGEVTVTCGRDATGENGAEEVTNWWSCEGDDAWFPVDCAGDVPSTEPILGFEEEETITCILWQGQAPAGSGCSPYAPSLCTWVADGSDLDYASIWSAEVTRPVRWEVQTSATDNNWYDVTWGAGPQLFVAVASSGTGNRVMTSPDGETWTSQNSAADNEWIGVTWGGLAGQEKFVAVAKSGTGNRVMTSTNGIDWTSQNSAADNNWVGVTWGGPSGQEKFVAVAWTGTGNRVMTSPDGVTWTSQDTTGVDNDWSAVTWGGPAGSEKFVAVATSGTGNRVMTSPDGVTWTLQNSAADNFWYGVTWGGPSGSEKFVAVAYSGTGNRVMTSPDGVTWTSQNSAADNDWYRVTWGGPAGQKKFVAVASSGTGNRVMTSPDGVTWTSQNSAADNNWFGVTWGGPSGSEKFVAVANSGIGNRVMTSTNGL
jgi:hypothetical protein